MEFRGRTARRRPVPCYVEIETEWNLELEERPYLTDFGQVEIETEWNLECTVLLLL